MADEKFKKFRYYIVFEVLGHLNSHSIKLDIGMPMESEGAIEKACDLIREQKPLDGITITNWKRVE